MKAISFLLSLLLTVSLHGAEWAELDGAKGNILKVSPKTQSFELLKETEYAPKSDIGQSRFTIHWDEKTRVVEMDELKSFEGIKGPITALFQGIRPADRKAMQAGKPFEMRVVTLFSDPKLASRIEPDENQLLVEFTPSASKERAGTIEMGDRPVEIKLRDRHWRIWQRKLLSTHDLGAGFWDSTIQGKQVGDRFVASFITVSKLPDPRLTDDPKLPRVLIIGDSISMNYFDTVKADLKGEVNLHRNQGNAFSTAQGVRNMELWLGDYQEKGFQWDVVQFNHGLHDLKQAYDQEKDEFGAYAVPLDDYKANLEKEIAILKKAGAKIIWCSTTPVPNQNKGKYARRKGAAAEFNQAAMEVIKRHPEILVTDLYKLVDESSAFDDWRKGNDVHFYKEAEREIIGAAVAATIRKATAK